jgi:hypothetical protein
MLPVRSDAERALSCFVPGGAAEPRMRPVHLVLLALVLAAGLWLLLAPRSGEPTSDPASRAADAAGDGAEPWMRLKSGTLLLRVRALDGSIPPETEAGYRTDRGERMRAVHPPRGEAEFTDAPLGDLVVVARAPGYQPLSRPARIEAGAREELVLVLEPEPRAPGR